MKRIPSLPFLAVSGWLATAVLFAENDPHPAWKHVQSLEVPGAGLVRLELPTVTIGASAAKLNDVRLVGPDGIEMPYLVEWPRPDTSNSYLIRDFHATLADQRTVLKFSTGLGGPVHAIVLTTSAPSFIKAANVEGSNDDVQWQTVAANEVIFRQTDKTERLRIPFSPGSWKYLRVVIDDSRWKPVPFTRVGIEINKAPLPVLPLPVMVQKRDEQRGRTRLTIPLEAANLWVAWLKVRASDPLFSRRATILANGRFVAASRLYRVTLGDHGVSNLTIPVNAQVTASELVVEIEDEDSPPLKIDSVEAARYPVSLAFHANAAGQWRLFTGDPAVPAPVYDMAALGEQLHAASSSAARAGELLPNPGFDNNATLPETGEPGAAIDLRGWAFRAPVTSTQRGVMQVELGLEVLAHASSGFGDLRLVQAGHQLPYLRQPISTHQGVVVRFADTPDTKRPTVSRWELKLPVKGMPITTLNVTSPTRLFARQFQLIEPVRDSYGNPSQSIIGSEAWNHKPGDSSPLSMLLSLRARGDTLYLETDNGDNSPVVLGEVTVYHPTVRLLFKTMDAAPIQLYYGNPQANTPHYDLSLVEKELKTAAPLNATLGREDQLKPVPSPAEESGQGSPWLWAVLAVVVGGLLWLMAKLLPKQQP